MASYLDNFALGQGLNLGGQGLQMTNAPSQGFQMPTTPGSMGMQGLEAGIRNVDPWGLMALIDQSVGFNAPKPGVNPMQALASVKPFQPQGTPAPPPGRVGGPGGAQAPVPNYLPQVPIHRPQSIWSLISGRS